MLDIIRPADDRYALARHTYSATGSPAAVVRVRRVAEVAEALEFARAEGGPLSIRSGGHGISSSSTNDDGTVIDLGRLDEVDHLGDALVRVGAGARWGSVAKRLQQWGLAVTSGDSGDVGVGGLATAGGIGLLGRLQGLTIDRVRAVDLVMADGSSHRVDAHHEPDVFWAVRGAGANIAIATSFEFEAGTTSTVAHASIAFQPADIGDFLQRWGQAVEATARTVSAFLYLTADVSFATVVVATADETVASRELASFTALPGIVNASARFVPYASVPVATHEPQLGQQSARTQTGLINHLDAATSDAIAAVIPSVTMVQIRSAGGAINDVPSGATAYAHRHQNFSVTAMSTAGHRSLETLWMPVKPLLDGTYLSFQSDHVPGDVLDAFPPQTLSRLRAIKSRWDPADVFSQNFDVTPPQATAGRPIS